MPGPKTHAALSAAVALPRSGPREGRARRGSLAAGRWVSERGLVLATGLLAAVPVLVAMVRAVVVGWQPVGDDAMLAIRAHGVLSSDPTLLGMPAGGATGVLSDQAFHPGPLLFWLLAVPARFLPAVTLPLTVGVVNVACVLGVVALARRRGGQPLMFAVAVALPVMLVSVPAEMHSGVWNPAAALLPFTLLVFLAWSVACGDHRLLPLAVVAASFAAQCHLTYVIPSLALLAVAIAGGLLALRGDRAARRRARPWLALAALVGLVCWSGPLVEQATQRPGNFVLLARLGAAPDPTLGAPAAWRTVTRSIGVPPWWLREPRSSLLRIGDLSASPSALTASSAVLVLVALGGLVLVGLRRGRRDMAAAGAIGLALCAALGFAASSVPESAFPTVGYSLWWASPAGMFAWLTLGWALATLLPRRGRRPATATRTAAITPWCLLAVAAVGAVVAFTRSPYDPGFEQMGVIEERLRTAIPDDMALRVQADYGTEYFLTGSFELSVAYALRRQGHRVTAPAVAKLLGDRYRAGSGPPPSRVVQVSLDRPTLPGARVIARLPVDPRDPENPFSTSPPVRLLTVSVAPAPAGG